MCVCTSVWVCVYLCVCAYVLRFVCVYTITYVRACVCVCVCVCRPRPAGYPITTGAFSGSLPPSLSISRYGHPSLLPPGIPHPGMPHPGVLPGHKSDLMGATSMQEGHGSVHFCLFVKWYLVTRRQYVLIIFHLFW